MEGGTAVRAAARERRVTTPKTAGSWRHAGFEQLSGPLPPPPPTSVPPPRTRRRRRLVKLFRGPLPLRAGSSTIQPREIEKRETCFVCNQAVLSGRERHTQTHTHTHHPGVGTNCALAMAPAAGAAARGAAAKEEAEWRIVLGGLKWVGLCAEQVGGGCLARSVPQRWASFLRSAGAQLSSAPQSSLK